MVFPLCGRPVDRAGKAHILGFAVVLGVALLLHYGLLPALGRRAGIRETPGYFLAVALVPVVPCGSSPLSPGRSLEARSKRTESSSAKAVSMFASRVRSPSGCGTPS